MAQDFGDDMGNALLNFVTRQTENYLRFGRGRERAFDWWQRHYKKEGNTPEQAKAMAEQQYDSESYSLTGEARDMTAAKTQIETETKSQEISQERRTDLPFKNEDAL